MLVLTLFICITFSVTSESRYNLKLKKNVLRNTPNKYSKIVTTTNTPETNVLNTTDSISTAVTEGSITTITHNGDLSTPSTEALDDSTAVNCIPGKSAYNKKDLESIVEVFISHQNVTKDFNDSIYPKGLRIREKYNERLKIFENKLEDRPQHLKHILQDMALTRQRIEPLVTHTTALLSQSEFYESSYRTIEYNVNTILEHLEKSKKICNLNCGHEIIEELITATSSRRFLMFSQVHCTTFHELFPTIMDRLSKFYIEYSETLDNRMNTDTIKFEEKLNNIKNKLKAAAVEQFGSTMYDILNLQDEYYRFTIDLKQYNITQVLQNIKQNEYEIKSKLLELESRAKEYRSYCNNCNDLLVYIDQNKPKRLTRSAEVEPVSLLDQVLNEITRDIQISTDKQYEAMFEELNRKLDETTIIETHLSILKPIKGEIDGDIKKEIETYEHLKSLVPETSIENVFKLADKSKILLRRVEAGLLFIGQYIQ